MARLRVSAARHGRSMEAEVRCILEEALPTQQASDGLGSLIRARFADIGGVEFNLPSRDEMP
jgi:plasmid stability protein